MLRCHYATGFRLATAEARAAVDRLVRVHDLYIASPNCTQPGFAHTQGAMYLAPYATPFTPAARAMGNRATRAAKIAEIWWGTAGVIRVHILELLCLYL